MKHDINSSYSLRLIERTDRSATDYNSHFKKTTKNNQEHLMRAMNQASTEVENK